MTLGNSKQNCSWQYHTMSKFEVPAEKNKTDKSVRNWREAVTACAA